MSLKSGKIAAKDPLAKLPKNHGARYAHVDRKVSTGASASTQKAAPTTRMVSKRRDEIFLRINVAVLGNHLRTLDEGRESIFALLETASEAASLASVAGAAPSTAGRAPAASVAASSVLPGTAVSVVSSNEQAEQENLLVLDMREPEEYAKSHVQYARSYPVRLIQQDKVSPELYKHKAAKHGQRLVIYHTDDKETAKIATLLVQKGWPRVYCLSGGWEEVIEHAPELIDGDLPPRPSTGRSNGMTPTKERLERRRIENLGA